MSKESAEDFERKAAAAELQALHEKYTREPKLTFFSPDAHWDELGNVCPMCLARTPMSARYPGYVCDPCTRRAVDDQGQPIGFFNVDLSGGLEAKVNGQRRDTTRCFIDGRPVDVEEARFGQAGLRERSVGYVS